jgi:hypothetical protein
VAFSLPAANNAPQRTHGKGACGANFQGVDGGDLHTASRQHRLVTKALKTSQTSVDRNGIGGLLRFWGGLRGNIWRVRSPSFP